MKIKVSTFLLLLLGAIAVGCDGGGTQTATEGATEDAIAEYEASLLEAEQSDIDADMEGEAELEEQPAAE